VEALDHLSRIDAGQIPDGAEIPLLIFVDLYMPEMGGRQFIDEFSRFSRGSGAKMRIILFPGSILSQEQHAEFESNRRCSNASPNPFRKSTLKN
jgi:CheY-like chemotaxis protein